MTKLKITLLVITCYFISPSVYSQKLSATFSAGYGVGLAKQDYIFPNRTRTNTTDIRESVQYSIGKGLQLNGTIGYSLNENIEAELGVSYLIGGKTEAVELDLRDPASITTDTYQISAKSLSFAPGIVFRSGDSENLQPYVKLAGVISIPTIKEDYLFEDTAGPEEWHVVWKYNGGLALGFTSAVGVNYKMESFDLFGELFITSLSYAAKEGEMTEATFISNATTTDVLVTLDPIDRQIQFVDSYDGRIANQNDLLPQQVLKTYSPMSNAGLRVGVRMTF